MPPARTAMTAASNGSGSGATVTPPCGLAVTASTARPTKCVPLLARASIRTSTRRPTPARGGQKDRLIRSGDSRPGLASQRQQQAPGALGRGHQLGDHLGRTQLPGRSGMDTADKGVDQAISDLGPKSGRDQLAER